jgi:hypothetical protein
VRDVEGQNRVTLGWGAELSEFGNGKTILPLKIEESLYFSGSYQASAGKGR